MNLLAMCNHMHQFIDVNLCHPRSTSNYLVFATSLLCKHIEDEGIIAPGYCLCRDSAFLNTLCVATPFKVIRHGPKDAHNYFQSQLRIIIKSAFETLVSR